MAGYDYDWIVIGSGFGGSAWFAERLGVRVQAPRTVVDVVPVGGPSASGADGYDVVSVRSGSWP
jgi:hypothetical protein